MALMVVPTDVLRVEFVSLMELRGRENDAATRGVPILSLGEGFVSHMVEGFNDASPYPNQQLC
jgi:hypothetical protein